MAGLRVIVHSIAFLIFGPALAYLAARTQNPGLAALVGFLQYGSYIPFSIAAASALNQHKTALLALLGITVLLGAPRSLSELATMISPIGAGVVIGSITRKIITTEHNDGSTDAA